MPTYEYQCKKCGKRFEAFQSINEKPITKCPIKYCGGSVFRVISPGAGFLFKGSGFYETDYRSESYKKALDAEKETTKTSSEEKSKDKKGSNIESGNKKADQPKK